MLRTTSIYHHNFYRYLLLLLHTFDFTCYFDVTLQSRFFFSYAICWNDLIISSLTGKKKVCYLVFIEFLNEALNGYRSTRDETSIMMIFDFKTSVLIFISLSALEELGPSAFNIHWITTSFFSLSLRTVTFTSIHFFSFTLPNVFKRVRWRLFGDINSFNKSERSHQSVVWCNFSNGISFYLRFFAVCQRFTNASRNHIICRSWIE